MKTKVLYALLGIACLKTHALAVVQTQAAASWEDYWQNELAKIDEQRDNCNFMRARAGYKHIATSSNSTIPESIRAQAKERLQALKNEPNRDFNPNTPTEYRVDEINQQTLDEADQLRRAGNYKQASNVYQYLRDNSGPRISGTAMRRLAAMRKAGEIEQF